MGDKCERIVETATTTTTVDGSGHQPRDRAEERCRPITAEAEAERCRPIKDEAEVRCRPITAEEEEVVVGGDELFHQHSGDKEHAHLADSADELVMDKSEISDNLVGAERSERWDRADMENGDDSSHTNGGEQSQEERVSLVVMYIMK